MAFNSFKGKNYVVSFEPTGLLFMGLTPLNQSNGNDQFVVLNEIGAIATATNQFSTVTKLATPKRWS
ncbi:hypothetical protein [Weissella cibaria]|uniref:hypothetical protein n=1 Tax=Weissella cibaria TaxID=137591 RepID=UPI001FD6EC8E|nr:hypothetical protein [Weissella cibaria]